MKKIITIVAAAAMATNITFAQGTFVEQEKQVRRVTIEQEKTKTTLVQKNDKKEQEAVPVKEKRQSSFHLDLGVTLGTDGIGLDLSTPVVENWVNVRAGFTYMPRFNATMHFGFEAGDESMTPAERDEQFDRLSGMLHDMIGTTVDKEVDMVGTPKFQNFKFLVDVTPFRNKNWHVTGGFYWGPSRIAYAENAIYDATSLVSTSFYNNLYDRVVTSYHNLFSDFETPYMSMGGQDLYADQEIYDKFKSYGRMKVQLGEYKDTGEPCYVEPDENNMMIAKVKVNSFRPYLGFGYGGRLLKNDDRYQISFDAGLMFWGGTPQVLVTATQYAGFDDGMENGLQVRQAKEIYVKREVNLAKDVRNIGGKVGDYVDVLKSFKVYPVISLRISRRLW